MSPRGAVGRVLCACGLVVCAAALTAVAEAQDDVADLVTLPGGGRMRGVVIEYEPGVRVVLRTPSGETRTWLAGQFESVELGDRRPSSAAAPVVEPPQSPMPPAGGTPPPPLPSPTPPTPARADEVVTVRWPVVRHLEDGRGNRVRWMHDAPRPHALPRGTWHLGARVLLAAVAPAVGPVGEVDVSLEVLPSRTSAWRLRADLGAGINWASDSNAVGTDFGGTPPRFGTSECYAARLACAYAIGSSGSFLSARALVEVDLSQTEYLGFGGELDLAFVKVDFEPYLPSTLNWTAPAFGGLGLLEAGLRTLSGHLDLGLQVGVGGAPSQELVIDRNTRAKVARDLSPRASLRLALFLGVSL